MTGGIRQTKFFAATAALINTPLQRGDLALLLH
jgi:hypothetical protein